MRLYILTKAMVMYIMLPVKRSPPMNRTKIKAIGKVPPANILKIPGKFSLKVGSNPPVTVVVMTRAIQIKKPTNILVLIIKNRIILLSNCIKKALSCYEGIEKDEANLPYS
jgi:hypothetical protein